MSELLQSRVALALDAVHLPTAKANLVTHLRNVADRELTPLEFLDGLLADELAARQERSIAVRTKLAHFPVLKTLDSFDFDAQATLDRRVLNELQTLAFVERAENVALLGPADTLTYCPQNGHCYNRISLASAVRADVSGP